MASNTSIITAYRHLLRNSLHAVQFAKPARFTVVEQLRTAFRDPKGVYEPERIRRTIWFLRAAAAEKGLEHKIVKNLVRVQWERTHFANDQRWKSEQRRQQSGTSEELKHGYMHYDATVSMLNDSMGLCLR